MEWLLVSLIVFFFTYVNSLELVLVWGGDLNKVWLDGWFISSKLWRLEVWNQGVDGAVSLRLPFLDCRLMYSLYVCMFFFLDVFSCILRSSVILDRDIP